MINSTIRTTSQEFDINIVTCFFSADKFQDNKTGSSIVKDLRKKGHNITEHAGLADVNGLSYFKEQVTAHGDSRRGGGQGSAQF